ncbi:MAG: NADH:flavin oxidoreductase/NADH oxidase family protein [Gammaproteobacteria bacterium]|nr:NADH:flavin oxidoreductase/NADH oxidase family protein [Gammaproteobacteria bacterium]
MPNLGDSLELPCGVTIPNRFLKSAMTEGLATPEGNATERHANLYRNWSEGGAGVLLTGNVMVDHRYLERPGNVIIDNNGGEEDLKAWAKAGTAAGNHLWMQISHPGRQCARIVTNQPVSPSDVQLSLLANFGKPRPLTAGEIPRVIERYAHVAAKAQECGFTGVQVHAAHGYLISQFLSPLTNQRTDKWGGSLENRARFLLEVVRAVRAAVGPKFPVAVKLNSSDFQKGGFSLEESQQVAAWLDEEGVDLLELSGGTYERRALFGEEKDTDTNGEKLRESTAKREAFFLQYTGAIRSACKMPIAVTGGFRSRELMKKTLDSGEVDVIGVARPLCAQPDAVARLIEGNLDRVSEVEHDLRLGNGWLGPNSRFDSIKGLNAQAAVAWFYRQIIAISENKPVRENLGAWRALWEHMRDEYRIGFKYRKARKQRA